MKSILSLFVSILLISSLFSQNQTYSTLTVTQYMDQIRFQVPGEHRYWFMSKTQTDSKAFALYSPDDGGWFTYWKEGSGDMILNKGKIGVGNPSPTGIIDVVGGTGGWTNPTLNLRSFSNSNAWSLISLKGGTFDETADYMIGRGRSNFFDGRALTLHIPSRSSFYGGAGVLPKIAFVSSGAVNLGHIEAETGNWYMKGNLGIGTENPVSDLHIASEENGGIVVGRPNDNMGFNGGTYDIKFYGFRDIKGNAFSAKISAERTNSCCDWKSQGTALTFHTTDIIHNANADNSIERMRITAAGTVGIGTSTPDPNFKLSVNGSIRSKEVKVETSWSDFVFYDDYELRTLEEVEQHIIEKGHLPEIPSEAEVAENGINVGEMNAKLLMKIEELTLYLIEQNEKIEALEKEVYSLKKE